MENIQARGKTCPFQSNVVHEPSPFQDVTGITSPYSVYCSTDACMAWQDERPGETGYCKLIEAQFPENL